MKLISSKTRLEDLVPLIIVHLCTLWLTGNHQYLKKVVEEDEGEDLQSPVHSNMLKTDRKWSGSRPANYCKARRAFPCFY